jgi:hypothetical protein
VGQSENIKEWTCHHWPKDLTGCNPARELKTAQERFVLIQKSGDNGSGVTLQENSGNCLQ